MQVDLDKSKMPNGAILTQAKRKRLAHGLDKLQKEEEPKQGEEGKKVRKKHRHDEEKKERREKQMKKLEEKMGLTDGEEAPADWATSAQFIKIHRYQPLMFLDFVGDDEMVVVERPWFGILESLPPSFHRKKYGEG